MTCGGGGVRLRGARVAVEGNQAVEADLEVQEGRIRAIAPRVPGSSGIEVDLSGYLILPGLINAHDHLEFNLFPRLGQGPYPNATSWARDIYRPHAAPVREHLSVPRTTRLWWGGLKNLLSGVTTVCHHNPYDAVFDRGFPVEVVRRYGWAHSIDFSTDLHGAFRAGGRDAPFVIHLGEGTDSGSAQEIFHLDRMGILDHRTVIVHGVGLTRSGHELRRARGAALVWCPTSNQFTLGRTLNVRAIGPSDRLAIGSDSALTARGTLLDEIRIACREGASPPRIYSMVTRSAADLLRLNSGQGRLAAGAAANMIAVPWTGEAPAEALMAVGPDDIEMVLVSGRVQLVSAGMAHRWPGSRLAGLEWLGLGGVRRRVRAPVQRLLGTTRACLSDVRLAGQRVSA